MLNRLGSMLTEKKNRDLALLGGGMVGIMTGAKLTPVGMFLMGAKGLEDEWRKNHPEFDGGFAERWQRAIEFYDETHQDPVNRALHTIGIPMIVGGVVGMLAAPRYTPPWLVSNASWTTGWVLNFIGHGLFEKGAPAFADDPLSFIAGPAWDLIRLRDRLRGDATSDEASEAPAPAPTVTA
jgi:hypothetical protein